MNPQVIICAICLLLLTSCIQEGFTRQPARKDYSIPYNDSDNLLGVYSRVYFEHQEYILNPIARQVLNAQIKWIKDFAQDNDDYQIIIEGHADDYEMPNANLALSMDRANTVRDYLTSSNIDKDKMKLIPSGQEKAEIVNTDHETWMVNRKVVIKIKSLTK